MPSNCCNRRTIDRIWTFSLSTTTIGNEENSFQHHKACCFQLFFQNEGICYRLASILHRNLSSLRSLHVHHIHRVVWSILFVLCTCGYHVSAMGAQYGSDGRIYLYFGHSYGKRYFHTWYCSPPQSCPIQSRTSINSFYSYKQKKKQ